MLTIDQNTFNYYKYYPENYQELKKIIKQLLEERGMNADLNDVCVTNITDLSNLFQGFNPGNIKIDKWEVSNVTDMRQMFFQCKNFNANLSTWDVSNVENMSMMFFGCKEFDSDLSNWNTGNVRNMVAMFNGCEKFNSDLNNWDLSNVENISMMFQSCNKFDKHNTDEWNVKNIKDVNHMNSVFMTSKNNPSWYKGH